MRLSSDYKYAFVSVIRAQAEASTPAKTFIAALLECSTARIDSTKGGRALISASGNGKVVSYAMPAAAGDISEMTIAELCGGLMKHYRDAKAVLIAGGSATPSDSAICDELIATLDGVTEYTTDYSEVR